MKRYLFSNKYTILLAHFKQWLDILGYAGSTVYSLPLLVEEFLLYLESKEILELEKVDYSILNEYYLHLQSRKNKRGIGGALSSSYLNTHQWALKKFNEYLIKHYQIKLPIHLKSEKLEENRPDYLTLEEVKLLFKASSSVTKDELLNQRYKAALSLLYCCGLRRNEATSLNVDDILFDRRLIVVQSGKNSKQRYVPINDFTSEILLEYKLDARIEFNRKRVSAFLLGRYGTRLTNGAVGKDLKRIAEATNSKSIIEKNITAHMLRHSIATHLLDSGMQIEDISNFLGHSSLESTQIYTHINQDDRL